MVLGTGLPREQFYPHSHLPRPLHWLFSFVRLTVLPEGGNITQSQHLVIFLQLSVFTCTGNDSWWHPPEPRTEPETP